MAPIASLLSDLLSDVLLTSVRVSDTSEIAERFVKIRLASPQFRRAHWTPCDKLQLRPQRGSLLMRTYTPISWDCDAGCTDVIGFLHGDGPGASWCRDVPVGAECDVFGPSRSLDLSRVSASTVFLGDETSVGLAHALRRVNPAAHCVYETTDPVGLKAALTALGIVDNTELVAKSDDRTALLQLAFDAGEAYVDGYDLVVSGNAAIVNAVRRGVRHRPQPAPRIKARAYWARGRTGLS